MPRIQSTVVIALLWHSMAISVNRDETVRHIPAAHSVNSSTVRMSDWKNPNRGIPTQRYAASYAANMIRFAAVQIMRFAR